MRWIIYCWAVFVMGSVHAEVNITHLETNGIANWQSKEFSNLTHYEVIEYEKAKALRARSKKSASGLVLEQKIDLNKTPIMTWSWLTKNKLSRLNERTKQGDDYVARIYLVIDGGLLVWNSKSINYVWSSNQVKGQVWDNPFAGSKVKMLAVQGKDASINTWYQEQRNVYEDLIAIFGDKGSQKANLAAYQYIDAVAIMTDTDNSQNQAETLYGDIIFTKLP